MHKHGWPLYTGRERYPFGIAPEAILAALLGAVIVLLLGLTVAIAHVQGHDFAQLSPQMRKWFQEQRQPGTNFLCCDERDGEEVEEDIRDQKYWIRSQMTKGEWLQVPEGAVLTGANKWGRPVAWFRWRNGTPEVFCYAPGPLT